MKNIFRIQFCVVILISSVFYPLCSTDAQQHLDYKKVGTQEDGSILVPTNQLLTPAGFQVYMPGRPVDLALIEGGELLAVKNKNSLDLIRLSDRTILQSLQFPESGSSFTGICYSENSKCIYLTDDKTLKLKASELFIFLT